MKTRTFSLGRMFAVIVALAMGVVSAANAESWRMATKMPPDSSEGKVFQRFADLVDKHTGGKLTVKVYPSEQLGKVAAVLEQMTAGTIHVYGEGSSFLKKWEPDLKYISAPFVFSDREHWVRFMETDLVKGWMKTIKEKGGLTVIGDATAVMRGPYRVIVSKRQVKSLADIQGLKLRMHTDPLAAEAWGHLGAEVRVLGWTEVYSSINRGIVDAVNSPIALVEAMKFYEVAPHITRHNEYPQSIGFMVNAKAYDGLAPDIRKAVDRAYSEAAAYSVQLANDTTAVTIGAMKKKGVTYTEINLKPFVDRMKSFYEAKRKAGKLPKGFLEAVEATRAGS
ncbi:MAG: TRAP transporter substrate-binding protein [Rhodospirillales bacterium]|jgi:tripartite ATP-independent transporter DctP family solute receptor|nr:TRAP transporter substrate-binding protein [Rhodospirillales bacterium]MDP7651499.1 TRAP transporter substrate-binding protein [Rhodospirillales bacterium]